jgi:hypothetical protein
MSTAIHAEYYHFNKFCLILRPFRWRRGCNSKAPPISSLAASTLSAWRALQSRRKENTGLQSGLGCQRSCREGDAARTEQILRNDVAGGIDIKTSLH